MAVSNANIVTSRYLIIHLLAIVQLLLKQLSSVMKSGRNVGIVRD